MLRNQFSIALKSDNGDIIKRKVRGTLIKLVPWLQTFYTRSNTSDYNGLLIPYKFTLTEITTGRKIISSMNLHALLKNAQDYFIFQGKISIKYEMMDYQKRFTKISSYNWTKIPLWRPKQDKFVAKVGVTPFLEMGGTESTSQME